MVAVAAVTVSVVAAGATTASAAPTGGASARVTRTVGVGSNPIDVAVSNSLGRAFVVNDGSVSVVSLITHRELAEFNTGGYHGQNAIALVRGDAQAYLTNGQQNTVTVVDTETEKVVKHITVGDRATDVVKANTPRGQRAYVSYVTSKKLTGIATSSGKIVQQVKLPAGVQTMTTVPGGKRVWAGSIVDGRVFVVNTSTGKVTRTIKVTKAGPVSSIAFSPNRKRAWVAGLGGVSVVNVKTGKTVKFLSTPKLFSGQNLNMGNVALTGSGRYALVENSTYPDSPAKGQLTAINTRTYKIAWRATTGTEPIGLAIDTKRHTAYLPNYADDTLTYLSVPK